MCNVKPRREVEDSNQRLKKTQTWAEELAEVGAVLNFFVVLIQHGCGVLNTL